MDVVITRLCLTVDSERMLGGEFPKSESPDP